MRHEPGSIIRFTYEHQDVDASTGDKFKEVLVLHPSWQNKVHGLDLKRLSPAERTVLEAVLDPEQKDTPHRIPLVNDIKRKMDPITLIKNPIIFYTKFIKPFLRGKDAYRVYIPARMKSITTVKNAKVSTGKKPNDKPLFGPKPQAEPEKPKAMTAIDIMKQNADARAAEKLGGLK